MSERPGRPAATPGAYRRLIWLTAALFVSYLCVAMALPVVSVQVARAFGYGDALAGLAVGISFLSTIATRGYAGRMSDDLGPKTAMMRGLLVYAAASLVCLASTSTALPAQLGYATLLAGRLGLGLGESIAMVGAVAWGLAILGPDRSGRVLSLIGIGMYGGFAVGGPLGYAIFTQVGFSGLMLAGIVMPLLGLLMVWPLGGVQLQTGKREPFLRVVGRIWRPGAVVGLQGVGFAGLGAFVALYFTSRGWGHAGLALTCFGAGFVALRLFAGNLPDRIGGARVAAASLAVETLGQCLMWQAPGPVWALLGALLTGVGCSMVFPSMGREVVRLVPPHLRGTAIGGFAAFQDLAYGLTGPVTGLFAERFGYGVVFLIGALCAMLGLALALDLLRRSRLAPAS